MKPCPALRIWSVCLAATLGCVLSCSTTEQRESRAELRARGIPVTIEALFEYVARENAEVVELLLKAGINVDGMTWKRPYGVTDDITYYRTPLMVACYMGNMKLVELLSQHGANLNALSRNTYLRRCTKCDETPLMYAAMKAHKDVVLYLVKHGADVNRVSNCGLVTALHVASAEGLMDIVKVLLAAGADVNAQRYDSAKKQLDGETALMYAVDFEDTHVGYGRRTRSRVEAAREQVEIAKLLLAKGADVNVQRARDGRTALMLAARSGDPEMVRLLVESGTDRDLRDRNGETALMLAERNSSQIAGILRK